MSGKGWPGRIAAGFAMALPICVLAFSLITPPPPLRALYNISVPMDAQIDASILARSRKPDELRVVFMSNCFFHGTVRNGDRVTVLPDSLTVVRRFERWLARQEGFREKEICVFNASVDGTSILDHIALTVKLAEYEVDAVVIAMAYTEFRRLPLHPLLGNLKDQLSRAGIDLRETGDLAKSRGRLFSVDFQRWLTAEKYEFYKGIPLFVRLFLWNRELRARLEPSRSSDYYRRLYGGEAVPLRHIGLGARIEQSYRSHLRTLLDFARGRGMRIVLVNQPIRFKEAIKAVNPGLFTEHANLLRTAADQYPNCRFIDLDGQIPTARYLSDYIHLTYDGAEEVSRLLNPALRDRLQDLLEISG